MTKKLEKMPVVVTLSANAGALGKKIAASLQCEHHGLAMRVSGADVSFENISEHIQKLFKEGSPIVAIMASGAVVRLLAPLIKDKWSEPPVVVVSEDGLSVIPLLGGHHGANDLAQEIGSTLEAHVAVTTAGDIQFGIALDQPPKGLVLNEPECAKDFMATLNTGEKIKLIGSSDWLENAQLPFSDDGELVIKITNKSCDHKDKQLVYHPKNLVLGIGCERGASNEEAIALVTDILNETGYSAQSISCITSIDLKADETAIHAVAKHFNVPALFFDAKTLEQENKRLENPSDIVFAEVGCHGVSEGAALAAVGSSGTLVVSKKKSKRVTCAIGESAETIVDLNFGRARGKLNVVGIGPGSQYWRSPEVSRMIEASTDLVGYSLYIDLLEGLADGKIRHDFDLGKEEARVHHAMELAGQGKTVSLICSGDAGIYAMATLVFELLDKTVGDDKLSDGARRIEIAVSPGISALQAAAARIGAPLGHDFCTISLSDLLTPWPSIQKRLKAAGEGDFVIAFYNPVSRKRRTQLAYARDLLLKYRPDNTPVILATNLGREGEKVRVVPLVELDINDVDMLTVVVVGSSESTTVKTGDGKSWVYTPRGYSGKEDSAMRITSTGENSTPDFKVIK